MTLHRSESAKSELASRQRSLNLRERSALFLADGQRSRQEMQALLQDDGQILQKLIDTGYLLVDAPVQALQLAAAVPVVADPPEAPLTAPAASDNFEGKRSLATTRMFLFDICERMFARKLPDMAHHYREQLREARDRDTLVAIAGDIILNVEELAGAERAQGLRERIALLLPLDH